MADTLTPPHPYQPADLILPNYDPANQLNQLNALLYIFVFFSAIILSTWVYTGTIRFSSSTSSSSPPRLTSWERFITVWFILNTFLHLIFEGTFLLHAPHFTLHSSPSLIPSLWREYALSDSRYLLPPHDPSFTFIYAIELITVFITGPLCLVSAWATVRRKEWRVIPQAVVATAHLWGVGMYFLTGVVEGHRWTRGEGGYVWGYFWGMNAPWVGVSAGVLWGVAREVRGLVRRVEGEDESSGEGRKRVGVKRE